MHKKIQSLVIAGILSSNTICSTEAIFADSEIEKKEKYKNRKRIYRK